ncbi:hypothetical protein FA95DRAFT_1571483 [Auriscalpium vulgare]|uniref:Uncharacterized protein n=1 Tax=Auriscalpium vulgare TaxID=40419 RepID=A0ACB8RYY9_9AGAM|nr:hypothetical protein FA95DRAFT_1571483 [Auriscalpium vulgare]
MPKQDQAMTWPINASASAYASIPVPDTQLPSPPRTRPRDPSTAIAALTRYHPNGCSRMAEPTRTSPAAASASAQTQSTTEKLWDIDDLGRHTVHLAAQVKRKHRDTVPAQPSEDDMLPCRKQAKADNPTAGASEQHDPLTRTHRPSASHLRSSHRDSAPLSDPALPSGAVDLSMLYDALLALRTDLRRLIAVVEGEDVEDDDFEDDNDEEKNGDASADGATVGRGTAASADARRAPKSS